ncbi:hypothetical protein A2642_02095 [Candidatus Nomurabacteria bacterium RIFCSPHIGHO2_01_FULL_39_10]|uniref:DUF5678 domain-containing protein n=1 Tax=Candidatus Nomurabacteria bacterium RIFCSPHIGHO2_01_FULL_39_10 TaxID=1801733 RepID=A0A1F6V3Q6_9BACT|nr:MAG: hypothetical protein A2642_02095 [Candidatus Nomurabacteria bacterium RIFCSPHIGHO2_01_FULL_39_10]
MKLDLIKKQFRNEWVLVEVLEEDQMGSIIDAKLLAHSPNRDDTYTAMKKTNKYTYHFYNGEIPTKGYAVAFYGKN